MNSSKRCTWCGERKELSEYHRRGSGLQSWCKTCLNTQRRFSRMTTRQRCYAAARYLIQRIDARANEAKLKEAIRRVSEERRGWPVGGIRVTDSTVEFVDGKIRVTRGDTDR